MGRVNTIFEQGWIRLSPRYLPFADAASEQLPMARILRLSLFQVTVGMAVSLLIGTLNRVIIVELGVQAWIVAVMVSLPLLFAPLRALIGHSSDTHRSVLGWRRVPFIWFGTLLQFGGLSIMPFALIVLSGDTTGPLWVGHAAAALAFLLTGAGLHTVQTVGLTLATELAPAHTRPRVVALLCMMLLAGIAGSSLVFGWLLSPFSEVHLIQVVQGAAVVTVILNVIALWKQEARNTELTRIDRPRPNFAACWQSFKRGDNAVRRLVATALGTAAFSMQDVLLEPYGGQIMGLSVGATTSLTALLAGGGIAGLWIAARRIEGGADPHRVAALGAVAGLAGFSSIIFAAPLDSARLFATGVFLIGLGGAMFAHGTLTATMAATCGEDLGLTLGAWGGAQATAAGLAIALGGIISDTVSSLAARGALGEALREPSTGYAFVYHLEIGLLFATLIAIGPLVRRSQPATQTAQEPFGLSIAQA